MFYQGPIYRPPSEADSLLVQATLGCPHNKCSFCMVYKKGPLYRVRPTKDIMADMDEAAENMGNLVETVFFPAGNSMAMPTDDLAEICSYAYKVFPKLKRITVYASMPSIEAHGKKGLAKLKKAGLKRLHVGLETGHEKTLKAIKKGTDPNQQIRAGQMALDQGFDLCLYVLAGIAGKNLSQKAIKDTAKVINQISQKGSLTVRIRTLVPKINTLLLHQIKKKRFQLLNAHEILKELEILIQELNGPLEIYSDHYTNYINLHGLIPHDRKKLLSHISYAQNLPLTAFRENFVGNQ